MDDLLDIWHKPSPSLIENNVRCHERICQIMEWELPLQFSDSYMDTDKNDFRPYFGKRGHMPTGESKDKPQLTFPPYHQVFNGKKNFNPNLSILDLIFNLGPQSELYLKQLEFNL